MLRFFFLALSGLILISSCKTDDGPARPEKQPPALDVVLKSGEARAGQIVSKASLIGGVTARGRIGDYKLYNDKVRFIISGVGRGNGYNPFGGALIDADLVRAEGEAGRSNYGEVIVGIDLNIPKPHRIEVINDGLDGKAARVKVHGLEAPFPLFDVITHEWFEEKEQDLQFNIEYILEPKAQWLTIEYSVHNPTKIYAEIGGLLSIFFFGDGAKPFVPGFGYVLPSSGDSLEYFAAVADEVSYLYARPEVPVDIFITQSGLTGARHGKEFSLRPRDTYTFQHIVAVADGDLNSLQRVWRTASSQAEGSNIAGRVHYPDGSPVKDGRVHFLVKDRPERRNYMSTARVRADGRFEAFLPDGDYEVQTTARFHVSSATQSVSLAGMAQDLDFQLDLPGRVRYRLLDQDGRLLPAKITIRKSDNTHYRLAYHYGEDIEPGYVVHTEYATQGEGVFVIPAGDYQIWVTRGGEYSRVTGDITVQSGEETELNATLTREVDTTGWMSTDTHVHAQLSPDSPDLYPFKVAAMVVEGLELPVSTDHEAIGDFNPAIQELGLESWIKGIIGSEVTTFTYGHFNAWPLVQDFDKPGNGRIDWFYKKPAETFAAIRENAGEPFIQINHPRSGGPGGYFSAYDYDRTTGTAARPDDFSMDWDGIEVANGCGVNSIERGIMLDWFSFLNRGHRKYGIGSTDSHKARYGQMGYPRTYVQLGSDEPQNISADQFRDAMMAGKMIVTCGPFFEFKVENTDVGGTVSIGDGVLNMWARVAAPSWMDVDQLEVLVNGEIILVQAIAETTEVERFSGTLTASITAGEDAWVIMRIRGDKSHSEHSRSWPSWGFTNPVFIDGNGDGQWTMK